MLVVPQGSALVLMEFIRLALPNPVVVHLYQNDFSPDETTVVGDMVENTFPGYAAGSTNFPTPPFTNGSGQAEIDGGSPAFFSNTALSAEFSYGYWVDSGPSTPLLWAERFTSKVSWNSPSSFLQVFLVLTGVSAFSG